MPGQEPSQEKPAIPPLEPAGSSASTDRRPYSWRYSNICRRLSTWALLSIASIWLLCDIWNRLYIWAYTPHQFLYQNRTLEEVSDPRDVVRPLVDENQPFDVVATVWCRKPFTRSGTRNSEDVLFSDVLFRGLTLKSKGIHAQVNLSIPLRIFEISSVLENYDLRASFTLVPQSPSLLDGFVEYKSWLPTYWMTTVEMSPPGKSHESQRVQEAIESYGVTIPLIDFGPVEGGSGSDANYVSPVSTPGKMAKFPIESTKKRPAGASHPYVVTRTDLRVVRMTELYSAHWYDTYQQALETNDDLNGCTHAYITSEYDWGSTIQPQDVRNCDRSFRMRANMETKIKVKIPSKEKQSRPVFVWTYAPFMDVIPRSWGPTDLVPMPVGDNSTSINALNVTWNVAFSASPPAQMLLAEVVGESPLSLHKPASTPYKKAQAQSRAQHIHWLHGHKFSDKAHIGRSLLIQAASYVASLLSSELHPTLEVYTGSTIIRTVILPRLHINYWKSRSSTVGISQIGLVITTVGGLATLFSDQYKFWKEEGPKDPSMEFISLGFTGLAIYMSVVMLASTLRLERATRFPYLKRREPSRLERASLRIELQGRWLALILLSTLLAQIVASESVLEEFAIVPRVGPAPDDEPTTRYARILDGIKDFIPGMLPFLGEVYQLALNHRLKTFAGQYKSAAWLALLVFCLERVKSLPWIVGELPVSDPLTLSNLVYCAPLVAAVIQAIRYPDVKQNVEEDHTD